MDGASQEELSYGSLRIRRSSQGRQTYWMIMAPFRWILSGTMKQPMSGRRVARLKITGWYSNVSTTRCQYKGWPR